MPEFPEEDRFFAQAFPVKTRNLKGAAPACTGKKNNIIRRKRNQLQSPFILQPPPL
jgi:hypothetical protein